MGSCNSHVSQSDLENLGHGPARVPFPLSRSEWSRPPAARPSKTRSTQPSRMHRRQRIVCAWPGPGIMIQARARRGAHVPSPSLIRQLEQLLQLSHGPARRGCGTAAGESWPAMTAASTTASGRVKRGEAGASTRAAAAAAAPARRRRRRPSGPRGRCADGRRLYDGTWARSRPTGGAALDGGGA